MFVRVLTEDQIRQIHETSLAILERIGVHVPHVEVLGRFADAGASVDHDEQRVFIQPELVERSLEQAGKTFSIYGRDTRNVARFGKEKEIIIALQEKRCGLMNKDRNVVMQPLRM